MITWFKKYRAAIFAVLILAIWGAIFYFIPADAIVESVGVDHAYIVAFFITLFAGFSAFTGAAAYGAVIEFSRGGADPLILGLVSGVGLFLSDSAFYLLVMRGRTSLELHFQSFFERVERLLEKMPSPGVYATIYLFCAVGPIPNDVILSLLMISGYRYRRLWPVLFAGDLTFMLFLSYIFRQ